MATVAEIRAAAISNGRRLKKLNAITALVCGAVPGLVLSRLRYPPSLRLWLFGIAVGLVWANAIEYFYHRFLLHWPKGSFGKGHLQHHLTLGMPEEPEHLPFGSSPCLIVALFAVNGAIAVAAECVVRVGFAPGILAGFSLYMIGVEEIHWRIHLGGWLPVGLNWTREYHLAHHDIPSGRYNVFLPLFDLLFGNIEPPLQETQAASMVAATSTGDFKDAVSLLGLKYAVLYLWLLGLAIGARYLWTSSIET